MAGLSPIEGAQQFHDAPACQGCADRDLTIDGLGEELRLAERATAVTPTALGLDATDLIVLVVDALEVYVGRDVVDVDPTVHGVLIHGFQGRDWLLRLVPEAASDETTNENGDKAA